MKTSSAMPAYFIPHGGGPCFFMEWTAGPADSWDKLAAWLRGFAAEVGARPKAILAVSAHWEEPVFTVGLGAAPSMLFDYQGFPESTYRLKYPAPGSPALAARVQELLRGGGFATGADSARGFDHGVFVPFLLMYPGADIPVVQLSLRRGLDPAEHLAVGRLLAPLREEGVLIVGSGMSYHNLRGLFGQTGAGPSDQFDAWLAETVAAPDRELRLERWSDAPAARLAHPREEHLLPLMVVAGAAGDAAGARVFGDRIMGAVISAHRFG